MPNSEEENLIFKSTGRNKIMTVMIQLLSLRSFLLQAEIVAKMLLS